MAEAMKKSAKKLTSSIAMIPVEPVSDESASNVSSKAMPGSLATTAIQKKLQYVDEAKVENVKVFEKKELAKELKAPKVIEVSDTREVKKVFSEVVKVENVTKEQPKSDVETALTNGKGTKGRNVKTKKS